MAIVDLTQLFLKAKNRAGDWSLDRLERFLQSLVSSLPTTWLNFSYNSGEDWASIMHEKAAIAFVRRDFPLIIIEDEWATKVEKLLEDEKIIVLRVPSMTSGKYSLDPSVIPTIFPNNVWVDDTVDPSCFSLGDLWWTTIT